MPARGLAGSAPCQRRCVAHQVPVQRQPWWWLVGCPWVCARRIANGASRTDMWMTRACTFDMWPPLSQHGSYQEGPGRQAARAHHVNDGCRAAHTQALHHQIGRSQPRDISTLLQPGRAGQARRVGLQPSLQQRKYRDPVALGGERRSIRRKKRVFGLRMALSMRVCWKVLYWLEVLQCA
jgi:hypothetical protein